MKFWLWANFFVLSSMQKTAFQNVYFKGTVLNIRWISDKRLFVFQSHQKSQGHEILSLGQLWANLKHDEAQFSKF